jgi:hypothetical protein
MPNIKDWKPDDPVQCLVFAPSKTGKTFGAGTFPRPNFIDMDAGIATLRNPEFTSRYGLRSVEYEQFTERNRNKAGIVTAHNAFDDACRYFDKWMEKGRVDQFDTWVVDSGTTLSEAALNKAIVLLGSKQLAMASQTHAQAITTGLVYPKQQDYGSERSMVEQFVDMVLDSGKNVVLLCHEKVLTNDAGVITGIVPLLTGKGVEAVCIKFDEIWYLQAKKQGTEVKRFLVTHTNGIIKAGTRYGIPDGTPWEWDAIKKEVDSIHSKQLALQTNGSASASNTPNKEK